MSLNRYLLLLLALCAAPGLHAGGTLRVSLLLGDVATRQTLEVVRDLQATYPALKDLDVKIYSTTGLRDQDMDHLRNSDLVVVLIRGRTIVDSIKDELSQVIRRGGQVYAFGSGYNDDDKALGIRLDDELRRYLDAGGYDNVRNGLLYLLSKTGRELAYQPVQEAPDSAIYDPETRKAYSDFDAYRKAYRHYREGRPWVAVLFYQSNVQAGSTAHVDAMVSALERRNLNVLPAYGYPPEIPVEKFLFDADGHSRVQAVVAISMKFGVAPDKALPLNERLDAPIIDAISLNSRSRTEWEASPAGLDIMERSWQVGLPEMGGLIQPTVFAAKEKIRDPATGIEYIEERPIPERVEMVARRVERWLELRSKPNAKKRVLLQYFNSPPGKERIGASNLNVLPESLWQVLIRLRDEGYDVSGMPADKAALQQDVIHYGANIPSWNRAEIDALARSGQAVLVPLEQYRRWFAELPEASRADIVKSWGPPEANDMMAYRDAAGKRYFVLPVRRYGNVLLAPQPALGWTDHVEKALHDVTLTPSHQYVAFYAWLRKEFKADAIVQFGTHGSHEWLPGKEVGLAPSDPPEYTLQDLPNLYYFIVDDPGEGIQAKRRGMGVMIDHLIPPLDKATLNPELRELKARLNDYDMAREKSPSLAEARLKEVNELAARIGVLKDLGIDRIEPEHEGAGKHDDEESTHALEHYLDEIVEKQAPQGLHTLGLAPEPALIHSTAEAIAGADTTLSPEQHAARVADLEDRLRVSAAHELDALVAGLSGRFIPAGLGGEPLRNPDVLPTGRNFYSFDPRRIPSSATYAVGARLASDLIENYKTRHGEYPDKLTYHLWGVETMRHEGVTESQIMALMGVRPLWDEHGTVYGVAPIPRAELGRPRIDVTIITSGEYRDLFANLVPLMDQVASVARSQDEPDNAVRRHALDTQAQLESRGIAPDMAARLAGVRIFSMPSGAYGTNVNVATERSDAWDKESQVADVYFMRMSHLYGQGFWGDPGENGIGKDLLKSALSGTKIAVHSRSSNLHQTLDNDDFFQYLGGTTMAIRAVDGSSPEVYVSNLADPGKERQETLEKMMGREMRTRYLNPDYIKRMMKEGYAGAKHINQAVQNLWGWQVTVPEAVDAAKWNEMYETYVKDRYNLDMDKFFRDSGNLWAYQALMTRMLEAVRKGYWKPDQAVVEGLGKKMSELVQELQIECTAKDCRDPLLAKLVQAELIPVPAAVPVTPSLPASTAAGQASHASPTPESQADAGQAQQVQGYKMETVSKSTAVQMEPITPWLQILGFLLLCTALWLGFQGAYGFLEPRSPRNRIRI